MKYLCALIALLLSTACSYAQTNSVFLMDRVGNIISTHSTIQSAYNAIPAALTQPYIIELQSIYKATLETYPIEFVEKTGSSSVNTIKIMGTYNLLNNITDTTDMFDFNGADWMALDVAMSLITTKSPTHHIFHFRNGATHNLIRRVETASNVFSTVPTGGYNVYFGPTTHPGGNSFNVIESCEFSAFIGAVASEGDINNPNTDITIQNNGFGAGFTHCFRFSKTDNIYIRNNRVYMNTIPKYTRGVIDITDAGGEIEITRNWINIDPDSGEIAGIYVDLSKNHDLLIANNMIHTIATIERHSTYLDTLADRCSNISGIWINGQGITGNSRIYHNSVLLWGRSAMGLAQSNCFRLTGNHGADIDVKNNIFANYRKFSKNGNQKVFDFNSWPVGITLNHNRYISNGGIAMIGQSTSLDSWLSYQATAGLQNGSETNSDSAAVRFVDGYSSVAVLHASMYGDVTMYAPLLPDVPADYAGRTRTACYKGAWEKIAICPSTLQGGYIDFDMDSCGGHYSSLHYYGGARPDGEILQWQIRPAGSSQPFTDIHGQDESIFYPKNIGPMEYRMQVSCIGSSDVAYSDTVTMFTKPLPSVDSIRIEKKKGWDYTFTALGAQLTTRYLWNFEEGSNWSTANTSMTYNFKTSGPHTIRLVVTNNNCGYDTVYATLDVGIGIENITTASSIKIYPNPATDRLMAEVAEHTPYTITDISGRIIRNGNIPTSGIDVSGLARGLYMLGFVLPDDTRTYTRFVKE